MLHTMDKGYPINKYSVNRDNPGNILFYPEFKESFMTLKFKYGSHTATMLSHSNVV